MIKHFLNRLSAAVNRIIRPAPPSPTTKPPEKPAVVAVAPLASKTTLPEPIRTAPEQSVPTVKTPPSRPPRLWNIGLDFGTAFTKCVVRDLGADEAYIVPLIGEQFLLPSEVFVGNRRIGLAGELATDDQPFQVQHLKMALAELASGKSTGVWAAEFIRLSARFPNASLASSPEGLTIYFLARTIQKAKAFISQKHTDFNEAHGDRCFLNMAVPVAHAEEKIIADKFDQCLRKAWLLARDSNLADWDLQQVVAAIAKHNGSLLANELPCYLYPEVSANVQSYIKSRAGADGLYLFVDVGAGTVDLSIFIYYTDPSNDRPITYVEAGVLPLGSSQIEIRAAQRIAQIPLGAMAGGDAASPADNDLRQVRLQEKIRAVKEGRKGDAQFFQAIQWATSAIETELLEQAAQVLQGGRIKLVQDSNGQNRRVGVEQWKTLKLLVGGGGAQTSLYPNAVNTWFQQCCHFRPEPKPIPLPKDLKWPANLPPARHVSDFSRFTVAYGLSFDVANLEAHRFPKEVRRVAAVTEPTSHRSHAPTKDEC